MAYWFSTCLSIRKQINSVCPLSGLSRESTYSLIFLKNTLVNATVNFCWVSTGTRELDRRAVRFPLKNHVMKRGSESKPVSLLPLTL